MSELLSGRDFVSQGGGRVVIQSILMLTTILLTVMYSGRRTNLPIMISGGVLFILGAGFGIAAVLVLGRNRTSFPRPRAGSKLIQHGICRQLRHPLYPSVMLASVGWALIWQSAAAFGVSLTLLPFSHAKARREVELLRQTFPDYAAYARRVPRFLPRFGLGMKRLNLVCNL